MGVPIPILPAGVVLVEMGNWCNSFPEIPDILNEPRLELGRRESCRRSGNEKTENPRTKTRPLKDFCHLFRQRNDISMTFRFHLYLFGDDQDPPLPSELSPHSNDSSDDVPRTPSFPEITPLQEHPPLAHKKKQRSILKGFSPLHKKVIPFEDVPAAERAILHPKDKVFSLIDEAFGEKEKRRGCTQDTHLPGPGLPHGEGVRRQLPLKEDSLHSRRPAQWPGALPVSDE